ncbi:MAG TPA: hypothetical protein VFV13_01170 [Acidimicrobiia bacterium]|nr:hypothetical protein [Acidimicrobiia bacterium]
MDLTRLIRVVRDRWVFVLVVAVLGAVAGWGLTHLNNQNIAPQFRAIAAISLVPEEGETVADLADELDTALGVATAAAGGIASAQPGSSVQTDPLTGRLLFVAQGGSPEEAEGNAGTLRQAYVEVDPSLGGGPVDDSLADIERQVGELQEQLKELQPRLTPGERELAGAHELVDLKMDAVRQQIVGLTVANAGASEDEQVSNNDQIARLEIVLDELEAEKAALAPPPTEELTPTEQLQANTIQRRLEVLGIQYEQLYLRKLGVTSQGRSEPIVVEDLTPQPAGVLLNTAIGFIAGMTIAALGLMLVNTVRKAVWLPADIPVPVLGDIPGRKTASADGIPWYDAEEDGDRKAAIQALRTAIEGRLLEGSSSLGIAGTLADPGEVHALAADLGASFATAGWSVLLIDADFENPSELSEYQVESTDLATLLELDHPDLLLRKEIAERVETAAEIRDNLAVVPAGAPPASPGDAVAGRHFRYLIEEASSRFDLVMVVGSEIMDPATQIQIQRLDGVLVAVWPGRSRAPLVSAIVQDFDERNLKIHGAVFLQTSGRGVLSAVGAPDDSSDEIPAADAIRPMIRTGTVDVAPRSQANQLVDRLERESESPASPNGNRTIDELGIHLLEALSLDRPGAYHAAADYVVTRVEDLLTTHADPGTVIELVSRVSEMGFIPLTPVDGLPKAGNLLRYEFEAELGTIVGPVVSDRMEAVLADGSGLQDVDLDGWLTHEFFKRHVEQTIGEPVVWHLTSNKGSIQVLVGAQRLDTYRLELLEKELVAPRTDVLRRDLHAVEAAGDETSSALLRAELEDVEEFGAALELLRNRTTRPNGVVQTEQRDRSATSWTPVWSDDVRSNLASVQRLGLLPFPVLTRSELRSRLSTGS